MLHLVLYSSYRLRSGGFRQVTGRYINEIPDNLDFHDGISKQGPRPKIKLAPSRVLCCNTLAMMHFIVEDTAGNRDWAIAAMPAGVDVHQWLEEWQGLSSMPCK
jgi:hypothetical protein